MKKKNWCAFLTPHIRHSSGDSMQRQPRCFMDIRKHQHRTASLFSLVQRTTTIISMSVTTRMELSSIIVCMCACVCVCVLLIYHLPEEKRNPFLRHNAQRRVCSQPRNDAHRLYIGAKRIIEKKNLYIIFWFIAFPCYRLSFPHYSHMWRPFSMPVGESFHYIGREASSLSFAHCLTEQRTDRKGGPGVRLAVCGPRAAFSRYDFMFFDAFPELRRVVSCLGSTE